MDTLPTLVDQSYREQVERARQQSPQEKFLDGLRLFDLTCRIMADGIRMQHPKAGEAEILRMLAERIDLLRKLEEAA